MIGVKEISSGPTRQALLQIVFGLVVPFLLLRGDTALANEYGESASERLFAIQNIQVDQTARSSASAQTNALEEAERIAYDKILSKLTQFEHRDRLPALSRSELQELILGIEVVEEQASTRRYRATLNIRFEPSVFSLFLARHDVPHVLSAGSGILVLHSHIRGLERVMWKSDRTVQQARDQVDWLNRIRSYHFPRGLMHERFIATPQNLMALSAEKAMSFGRPYQLDSVLLIETSWNGHLSYSYRLDGQPQVNTGFITSENNTPDTEVAALTLAYGQIISDIEQSWRKQLIVDTGTGGEITVVVRSESLLQFAEIMKRIEDVNLIRNKRIGRIALPSSDISLEYTGSLDQLRIGLDFAGLAMVPFGDKYLLQLKD